jgi:hypothetical protein
MPEDEAELRQWREWWKEKGDPREVPLEEVSKRFVDFLEERLGTERIHPRCKKWWTPEINQAHLVMGQVPEPGDFWARVLGSPQDMVQDDSQGQTNVVGIFPPRRQRGGYLEGHVG